MKLRIMDGVNNNQFEVKSNSKRKINTLCPNVYLNPALDLLANDDKICNTAMEILPKKRKLAKNDISSFENTGLDLGSNKIVNKLLVQEIDNVRRNVKYDNNDTLASTENMSKHSSVSNSQNDIYLEISKETASVSPVLTNINQAFENNISKVENSTDLNTEPIYANITENKNEIDDTIDCPDISRIPKDFELDSGIILEHKSMNASNVTNITNSNPVNNSNISLSFIDRLALDSPNVTDQSLYLDDDLNESNIMEIKTITIITKKKKIVNKSTNPFLDPKLNTEVISNNNPFLQIKPELAYQEVGRPVERPVDQVNNVLMPRRLFDTNSTISTVNDSIEIHEYENIDANRVESPIYENIEDLNKQSKILGHDVSHFSAIDIMNLNKTANTSNDKRDLTKKHSFLKVGNKLSKRVFKTLKKTFKQDKVDDQNIYTQNPYEVPRKPTKQKEVKKETGIENPALNLDISDELEIEELSDEEHHYETIKTKRNTELNMKVTPLKARNNEVDFLPNKTNTPSKKVRFDSTLNREKVITGNSFDYGMESPGFDSKIEKYHDELENCINERKFLQQNM